MAIIRFYMPLLLLIALPFSAQAGVNTSCKEIQRGIASWYGPGFEGALTQNEEAFDPSLLSAAHPSLPFGTLLKVINMRNHKSVMVRVNDRGGFDKERVIDLSQGAALKIGMINAGTAPVAIYKCKK